jgi:uncharacterized protein
MPITNAPRAFHVLAKPTGAICNLNCAYCFFLSKENLYPNSHFRMPDEILETYLRQYLAAQKILQANIVWQGGEPTLMGLEFFQRSVQLVEQLKKPRMQISYAMQTNGTKLDDDWGVFLKQNNFLVGISIDGPRPLHDKYRLDKGGRGSFDAVMRGLEVLKKHRVDFNILCTVHAGNGDHPLGVYRFFRDELEAEFIQFIPIVERDNQTGFQEGSRVTRRSIKARQYGRFLSAIFDEWVRYDVGRVSVQIFDVALGAWGGAPPSLCIFSPTCGNALALEHNGDLYACDHFVEPDYLLGNILEENMLELVASKVQRKFGRDKLETLPRYCQECEVRFVCHGGCPKNRFITTPDGEPGLNYLCAGYKQFFKHIEFPMRLMAYLLRQNRAPAEVMQLLPAEEARIRTAIRQAKPGDPCPCGSRKPIRHCHGRKA